MQLKRKPVIYKIQMEGADYKTYEIHKRRPPQVTLGKIINNMLCLKQIHSLVRFLSRLTFIWVSDFENY